MSPPPSIKLRYINNSQAWNIQRETYTTAPSINKQYNISGNWNTSPAHFRGSSHEILLERLFLIYFLLLDSTCQQFSIIHVSIFDLTNFKLSSLAAYKHSHPKINGMLSKYLVTPPKKLYQKLKMFILVKPWWQSTSLTDDCVLHITAYD